MASVQTPTEQYLTYGCPVWLKFDKRTLLKTRSTVCSRKVGKFEGTFGTKLLPPARARTDTYWQFNCH